MLALADFDQASSALEGSRGRVDPLDVAAAEAVLGQGNRAARAVVGEAACTVAEVVEQV